MIQVGPDFERVDRSLVEAYRGTTPATVGHVLHHGFADPAIRPVYRGARLVGSAFTVQIESSDIAGISKAYELVQPGDVLVVASGRDPRFACAGEMSTFKSIRLGLAGLVVDGSVTDALEMETMKFPCFARYITPMVGRRTGENGSVRLPVTVGGVQVNPGDLVLADYNGVVFLNPLEAAQIIDELLEKERKEVELREAFWRERGEPVPVIYG
jgi:4-hydroxy-4-methyl-2-oxoglutarate aldolase